MKLLKTLRTASAIALLATLPMATPATALKFSAATADVALNAWKAEANSGYLRVYSGTQPASPDTALSGNTLLATFTFSSTACGSPSTSGNYRQCTLSFAATTVTAAATGTATFFRIVKSDGTTVVSDGTVGAGSGEFNLNSVSITSGGNVTASSGLFRQPWQ